MENNMKIHLKKLGVKLLNGPAFALRKPWNLYSIVKQNKVKIKSLKKKGHVYPSAHCGTIYNGQEMEAT